MKYFKKIQVHSGFSALSSNDVWPTKEIKEKEFKAMKALGASVTVSEKYRFAIAYDKSDKFFYERALSSDRPIGNGASGKELKSFVKEKYLAQGWELDNEYLTPLLEKHWDDEDKERVELRIREGYVIPEWSADLKPESYQGGFSDEVFSEPYLQKYLDGGGCHGYIGHSVRKPKLDAYFEKTFLKSKDDKWLLAMWLTSTGGRHFCDSLEGYAFEVQREKIDEQIESVIEQAERYKRDEKI